MKNKKDETMSSDVYFMDMEATFKENLLDKLARLIKTAGIESILKPKDLTAIKIHFGERGNTAYIRPVFIRKIIQTIKEFKVRPFLTDSNTLYAGYRSDSVSHLHTAIENGFSYSSMDCTPIIIMDGLRGKNESKIKLGAKHCEHVYIGSEIVDADALISVAHFKGHHVAGFGGTLKNLGMGCASRRGKLHQHSNASPKIKRKKCIGCGECAKHCPSEAIYIEDKKAYIKAEKCIGCAECIIRCQAGAININWNEAVPVFLEKMMEYTKGTLENKKDKAFFINFITDISPNCDCLPYNDTPIVNNIGIIASKDPVAIDQAGVDLINKQQALPGSCLKTNLNPGEDKFRGLYPDTDWSLQLEYAEKLGLGSRDYRLLDL